MAQETIPGTVTPYISLKGSVFAIFSQMISAAGGLTLAQVCSITGLEGSTVQNWVKRGFVANPIKKKYYKRQLARILIINALRDCMQLEQTVLILKYLNGDVEDESDDRVSEPELFDCFCAITKELTLEGGISHGKIDSRVKSAISDFKEMSADSSQRLYRALKIMVYAFAAGQFKREAELRFNQLEI